MASVVWAVKGPRLIRLLRHDDNNEGKFYVPNMFESGGDKFIKVLQTCWSLTWWTSPVIMTMLYRRGYCSQEGAVTVGKFLCSVGIIYASAYCLRGIGRLANPDYMMFINVLVQALKSPSLQNKHLLHRYDFEFWAWPVDFRWNEVSESKVLKNRSKIPIPTHDSQSSFITRIPSRILSYIAIHTFGRRMVYPGATSLMGMLVGDMLNQGRAVLLEQKGGQRAKLLTEDNNEIDTMFVDRRSSHGENGHTLVICFEGNAGFYEMGCSGTPMDCGYSVLGWNHPGFAGSTGVPFPESEQNAVDVVMQYAINRLGFTPDNIILFAWSIGGYSATWASMMYPDVKAVILDATFDDIVPLAVTKMPESWCGLVTTALRTYMNLNIADQLLKYPGPVKLIRRSKDEIISTETVQGMQPDLYSNRGNFLLIKLLQYRFPNIVDDSTLPLLQDWLRVTKEQQDAMLQEHKVNTVMCEMKLSQYVSENSSVYPMHIGENYNQNSKNQIALYLARMHMQDFESTHCTPLPVDFFHHPWSPL